MKKRRKYKGIYTDDFGTTAIVIENDFENLYVKIDGVQFSGSEFTGLFIIDKEKYTKEQLKRFTFFETPIYNEDINEEGLCSCIFEVFIPQAIIDTATCTEFYVDLKIEYLLGGAQPIPRGGLEDEKVKLSMSIKEKLYIGISDLM